MKCFGGGCASYTKVYLIYSVCKAHYVKTFEKGEHGLETSVKMIVKRFYSSTLVIFSCNCEAYSLAKFVFQNTASLVQTNHGI